MVPHGLPGGIGSLTEDDDDTDDQLLYGDLDALEARVSAGEPEAISDVMAEVRMLRGEVWRLRGVLAHVEAVVTAS